jgi:glutaryl-CoA dehydrogenase (non-decarboxylating)
MLGEEGEGFKIAMFALEQGRYTVAAGATGIIRASRDASIAYALERETFGTKIANHQLVKQKIAEMEADYQMSHLLWLRAGYLKNEGKMNARETSLAKWQATVRSEKAASMAIEVHGANGYSNDYPSRDTYATAKRRLSMKAHATSTRSCRPIGRSASNERKTRARLCRPIVPPNRARRSRLVSAGLKTR